MIRMTLLIVFLLALWIYAFRDWMVSLRGLILLTMLTQNDDLPRSIAGIQGLNPWNLSLLIVTITLSIRCLTPSMLELSTK